MAKKCENCGSSMSLWCDGRVKRLKAGNANMLVQLVEKDRIIAQVRDQRTNIAKQLGRAKKSYMKLRNGFATKARDLHVAQSQIVGLAEWCQKKFGIIVGGVLGKGDWPNKICEVVAKIVDNSFEQTQIGWYDPGSKRFCYMDVKEHGRNMQAYAEPVFIRRKND